MDTLLEPVSKIQAIWFYFIFSRAHTEPGTLKFAFNQQPTIQARTVSLCLCAPPATNLTVTPDLISHLRSEFQLKIATNMNAILTNACKLPYSEGKGF